MENLIKHGASDRFFAEATLYPNLHLARVISQYKDLYKIATSQGETLAEVSGKFRFENNLISEFPAVGDFVMVDRTDSNSGNAIIHNVLTRKSIFQRKAVGSDLETQVIATNIDYVFICMSLNNDFNLSRLERYLSVAWDSRAKPIIILTKSDLCKDLTSILELVNAVALDSEVIVTSSLDENSCKSLLKYLQPGMTASFIGSSGVGKSTLINLLLGEELLSTSETRGDDKGRHTSTRRELLVLPQGGIVIDTPGMRELGLDSADLSKTFSEIEHLESQCRFSDCTHTKEPGCAILSALESGELEQRRYDNYLKLKKEAKYDGLSSKEIETEKLNTMFDSVGGMKKSRKFLKEQNKRR